jgi:hypothetical protein
MGHPILDPTLRVGRFLLSDVLRSFEGAGQWFLRNIAFATRMSEPLLGEIMGNLMRVKAARFVFDRNRGDVYYEQGRPHPVLSCKYVRDRLTRQEADRLIDVVCDRATKLNKDDHHRFTYQTIYLFGSCLNHKEHPGDVDIALDISYRGGGELPQPSPIPFVPPGDFGRATRSLYGRGERFKISLHHYRELLAMAAPYRCIWTRKTGRLEGAIIHPPARPESKIAITRTKSSEQNYQKQIDALAARIRAVQRWPKTPALELEDVDEVSPTKWRELQESPWVLAHAHQMCLPECATKTALTKALAQCKTRESKFGKRWAAPYIKTSLRLNPWSLRPNGRLLLKKPVSKKPSKVPAD